jgi:hypothetical protein
MTTTTRRIPYNGGKLYRKLNVYTNKSEANKEANELRKTGVLVRVIKHERVGMNLYEVWTHGLTF